MHTGLKYTKIHNEMFWSCSTSYMYCKNREKSTAKKKNCFATAGALHIDAPGGIISESLKSLIKAEIAMNMQGWWCILSRFLIFLRISLLLCVRVPGVCVLFLLIFFSFSLFLFAFCSFFSLLVALSLFAFCFSSTQLLYVRISRQVGMWCRLDGSFLRPGFVAVPYFLN